MIETRARFEGLSSWEVTLWYALVVVSTAIFAWGSARLVLKYRRGFRARGFDHPARRLTRTAFAVFSHSDILRRHRLSGTGHFLSFYGFLVLFIGTVILSFNDDVTKRLFGFDFWQGSFYLVYSLILDIGGAGLVVGLALMVIVRAVKRPPRLDYSRVDRNAGEYDRTSYVVGDWVFLGALGFLALTGFLLEAFRIAEVNPSFEVWSPVGWLAAQGLRALGLQGVAAAQAHHVLWWVHCSVALAFVAAIPFTKAVHMLVSPVNLAVRGSS